AVLSRGGGLAMARKVFNVSSLWRGKGSAETGAFQRRRGRGEAQGVGDILLLGNGQREGAVEHIAGTQGVHGMHRKGRRVMERLAFIEPKRALRALRSRQERRGQLGDPFERLGVVGDTR